MTTQTSKNRLLILSVCLILLYPAILNAQMITEVQFNDKPIREILTALGQLGGKTVIVDETVTGNATHYIKNKSFDQALQIILDTNHLYSSVESDVIIVSKINVQISGNGLITLSAEQVGVELILRRLAHALKRTILYEPLPQMTMDLNLNAVPLDAALNIILKRLKGYTLEAVDQSFFIKAVPDLKNNPVGGGPAGLALTVLPNGNFSLSGKTLKVSEVVERLFTLGKREYSMMKRSDVIIDRINYVDKTFDQMLRLILELSDGDFSIKNDIYYIIDINHNDILKKLDVTEKIQLHQLSVNQVLNLLPSKLLGGNVAKVDKTTNSLLLSGSQEELAPIISYIRSLDNPPSGMEYTRIDCRYLPVESVPALLPESFKISEPVLLKSQNALLMLLSPELAKQLRAFMDLLDRPKRPQIIALKYIRADDLMAKLPNFLSKDAISIGPDQRYVFFTGSPEQFTMLQEQMKFIDLPVPQIKYQVLIVQYIDKSDLTVKSPGLSASSNNRLTNNSANNTSGTSSPSTNTTPSGIDIGGGNLFSLSGILGQATGIDLSLITSFGYNFAASLSANINENTASVLANTTLNALSNQDVSFRNTSTYRYREPVTNTDTGTTTANGVIREVKSGLIVTLKGWVSGDGMVTMTISTTFSSAGTVTVITEPPPTYEKIFTTTVRSPSGKAVVLGGLMESESNKSDSRTPGLSEIPAVGELFKGKSHSETKVELMVYVIPRVENPMLFDAPPGDAMMYLYKQHAIGADDGTES